MAPAQGWHAQIEKCKQCFWHSSDDAMILKSGARRNSLSHDGRVCQTWNTKGHISKIFDAKNLQGWEIHCHEIYERKKKIHHDGGVFFEKKLRMYDEETFTKRLGGGRLFLYGCSTIFEKADIAWSHSKIDKMISIVFTLSKFRHRDSNPGRSGEGRVS